ncbi:iron uptake system component EfeO [Streptomyces griseochromogenes]|uniref:Iron transporter n=1 Tax=Streptomyces griseochromogenes TaxID=68214 RepID=A0A1B1AXN7_9ACTN|nr:EfeM/EfeO family lipoprotein [Streptomyces griseochromogenes]ANP51339.1 iron transporter [Streptomyces griseochromogenes]MBP2049958.1 iron uptake system component EfeO [Streptomyces griseochromogenes]
MPLPRLGTRSVRFRATGVLLFVLALAVGGTLLGFSLGGGHRPRSAGPVTVEVSPSHCGRGWTRPAPGVQTFDLHNASDGAAEVYLEDPGNQVVYGEVEGIGPGTTRQLTVRLGQGTYAFKCVPDDADAVTGPTVHVTSGRRGPGAAPVTEHDLIPPALAYQKWVGGGLDEVVRLTAELRRAVDRGDLAGARAAWLPAHLEYERLGAAYDAFGDADGQINGTDAGLPDGVGDKGFTGFHRIEYGLWHGQSADRLRAPAAALVKAVTGLRDSWSQSRMDPAQLGLRAHEILENTVQFELTGRTDYGSGSNLATARANLDGTREVLSRLRPLLTTRYADLSGLDEDLGSAQHTLDGFRHGEGWTALSALPRDRRERVDSVFGDLVERLASVATLCDPRRTA